MLLDENSTAMPSIRMISSGTEWFVLSQHQNVSQVLGGDNLQAWWRLDEAEGELMSDSSLQSYNGDLNGASFSYSSNSLSGKVDGALTFNGSSDYVEVDYDSYLNSDAFTFHPMG